MYEFNSEALLNWITAFAIFEIPMAYFYLSISGKNDMVTNWYSGNTINIWNTVMMLIGLPLQAKSKSQTSNHKP